AECDNEIDVLADKFASQRGRSLVLAFGPNEQETNITSVFPADRPHVAPERFGELIGVLRNRPQYPNHGHADLLRARREWPGSRGAKQRDELAAFHSIPRHASGLE